MTQRKICKGTLRLWRTLSFLLILFSGIGIDSPKALDATEQIALQLAWKHQFQFAGYYAAHHKGYYSQAGLDVRIVEGGEGRFAREELLNGNAQYGIAGAELILHRAEGDPFVVLAPIFQHSPSILLVKGESGISNLQDLLGKRVMILPGKKDADILAAFLNEGVNLDSIKRLNQTYNLDDLIEGRTDAVSAYLTNEPWHLQQNGITPKIISPQTYGVDFYSDCLFTTEQEIESRPNRVNQFLAASLKGWEYAMSNPEEIIDLILTEYGAKKQREHLRYEAKAIKQIMFPGLVQIGHMNPGRWRHIVEIYAKLNMMDPDYSMEGFLYNTTPSVDYTWVIWSLGIALFISLFAGTGASVLLRLNQKLKAEIAEREQMEKERRSHIQFLEGMNRVNRAIQRAEDPKTMLRNVLGSTLSILECDRAWLLYPCDPDAPSFQVPFESTRPEYPGAKKQNLTIPINTPVQNDMRDALSTDLPVTYGPGNEKPLSGPSPNKYNVLAQMFISVHPKTGNPWMFGVHQCSHERVWTNHEKSFFTTIARRVSDCLNSMLYQHQLAETRNLLNSAFEQSPIPMAVADLNTNLKIVNPACRKNLGIEDLDIVGEPLINMEIPWETYTPEGKRLEAKDLPLARAIQGETVIEELLRVVRRDRSSRWIIVSANPVLNDQGNQIAAQIVFPDVTEIKEIEAALRESEEKYRLIFDESPTGIMHFDNNAVITSCNQRFADIMGSQKEKLIGFNIMESMPDGVARREVEKTIKSGTGHFEGEYQSALSNKKLYIKVELRAIRDASGRFQGAVGIFEDITDGKQAEKEKIKAQNVASEHRKLALVGQIAGKMSHDFNNILGIIMGNTELAIIDCKDEKMIKTLELILDQTKRGKNLTRNLVAFAKDQEPRYEYFKIHEKIDLVLNLLKRELQGISVAGSNGTALPDVLADPGMIEHALVNLIQNSIHATSMSEAPRIHIRTFFDDDNICIEIEDNGCGIPEESVERIYDPAFTLKGSKDMTGSYKAGIRGTGYGMANVKKYIAQHKGRISVSSDIGSGTRFTICLPVFKKELTKEEKAVIQNEITQYEKYILLVEDETAISDVQYKILTQAPCKHKMDIANNGQVAMDLFDRNDYDFVSLDYILPGEINGMDVYKHIRKKDKRIPVLFISGNIEFLESIKQLKGEDINIDHLSKPCPNKEYVNAINRLLEQA